MNKFSKKVLIIDPEKEVKKITGQLRQLTSREFRRRGLIVALSGGIDSSVTTALSVKAVGKARVLVLLMPERHSSDETLDLSTRVAAHFGVEAVHSSCW